MLATAPRHNVPPHRQSNARTVRGLRREHIDPSSTNQKSPLESAYACRMRAGSPPPSAYAAAGRPMRRAR